MYYLFIFLSALTLLHCGSEGSAPPHPPPPLEAAPGRPVVSRSDLLLDQRSGPQRLALLNTGDLPLTWEAWSSAAWINLGTATTPLTVFDSQAPLTGSGETVIHVGLADTPPNAGEEGHVRLLFSNGDSSTVNIRLAPPLELPPLLETVLPGGATMEFVRLAPGSFSMGSFPEEEGHRRDEGPPHSVEFDSAFYIGRFEITQAQWESVTGRRPWSGSDLSRNGPDLPAVNISWEDVDTFIERLNAASPQGTYRLPTEAEWEYAARAGSTAPWPAEATQLPQIAWYRSSAWELGLQRALPVGTKTANAWGLHDMHGNVWEWVADWYGEEYYRDSPDDDPLGPLDTSSRVLRGGGFVDGPLNIRSAARFHASPSSRSDFWGTRLVYEPALPEP